MTIYYVDSAAGSNTAPYDTWGKAAILLSTISAIDGAGDTVYVASTHSETSAGSVTYAWAGTATAPTLVICADKTSGAPPATIATGASLSVTNSGGTALSFSGVVYTYGLTGNCGATSAAGGMNFGTAGCYAEQCTLNLTGASSTPLISVATRWKNCTVKFGAVGQGLGVSLATSIDGCTLAAGGTTPTALFTASSPNALFIRSLDLTNAAATINLFATATTATIGRVTKSKMPASWSGSLNSSTPGAGSVFELINSDNAGTNYQYHRQTQFGDIYHETTLVRTGGSSDGTTPISWKMVSLASAAVFPIGALTSAEIASPFNSITNASVTATVELLHDNATGLKNDEIWIEVRYFSDSGDPLGAVASSSKTNILATGATLGAGVGTGNWNTSGMSNANSQKMSVSFTPQLKGPVYITVFLAKASYTVYVDRKVTLS